VTYSINPTTGNVTRDADGKVVSPCQSAADPDFVAYNNWVAAGNLPTEVVSNQIDPTEYTKMVQSYLDAHAQSRGWDSIYTAAIRASYAGPWQSEGIAFAQWMDACWVVCHAIFNNVLTGARTAPSFDQVIAELPPAPVFP